MADPTEKINQAPQYYSPPIEAQRDLMSKARPEKRPGDVCLGVVKSGGNELLVYSQDDSGGACHVGGMRAEKVGYVSRAQVDDFIKKYSPPVKGPTTLNGMTSLVVPRKPSPAPAAGTKVANLRPSAQLVAIEKTLGGFMERPRGEVSSMVFSERIFSNEIYFQKFFLKKNSFQEGLKKFCSEIEIHPDKSTSPEETKILKELCKKEPPPPQRPKERSQNLFESLEVEGDVDLATGEKRIGLRVSW